MFHCRRQVLPLCLLSLLRFAATTGFVFLFLCLSASASQRATDDVEPGVSTKRAETSAKEDFSEGLFWSIAKDGEIVGYIFGTFHSNDQRVLALLTERIQKKLESSYSFSMEAFPGSRYFNPHYGFRNVADDMILPKGETLLALIGKDDYAQIEKILVGMGGKPERVMRLRPWAAMNELGKLGHKDKGGKNKEGQGPIMDHLLYEQAIDKVVDLYQLETLEELMAAYYDFPMDAQIALLRDRLRFYKRLPRVADSMLDAYLHEDLHRMMDLSKAFISPSSIERGYGEVYLKHVLHIRNIVMAHYILLPLRRKNAFIAVGALHLYGRHGLLSILRDNYGFSVQRLMLHELPKRPS